MHGRAANGCRSDARDAVKKLPDRARSHCRHRMTEFKPAETPDGRYLVVRGRLWRKSNPALSADERERLVGELMRARRALGGDTSPAETKTHRHAVDAAKRALGERGPVWWADDAADYNRHLVKNTPYADWFASFSLQRLTDSP